jgi:eukaryotic-like serine/threonine-protein kinase
MAKSEPPDRVGEIIAGRYRLVEQLDKGGQGVVYRALDQKAGDEVAIKVLSGDPAQDVQWRERMMREAHALTVLAGTSAVRVVHQAWADDGAFCLVTELLKGADLEEHLIQLESEGTRLGPGELCLLLEPVVSTLETAHAAGILHRDIKPRNVFVLETGGVRLLDFGFAKFTRMRAVTRQGVVAGSPSYIAPEIWGGSSHFDQRIDVYSLGAVAFRALGGTTPFRGSGLKEILERVTTAPRPSLHALRPDLDPAIDDWVSLALAIRPEERFDGVRALWNALGSF